MKRRILSILLCLFVVILAAPKVSASTLDVQVFDGAGLLSDSQEMALDAKADDLMEDYGMDVVILTLDTLNGASAEYTADSFYDDNQYGDDGLVFLLAMQEREWYISTCGNAIYALTDYGIQQLGDTALPYLSAGDYYGGFDAFLDALPDYFDAYERGDPIDGYADYSGDYYHGTREEVVYYERPFGIHSVMLSFLIGLGVAAITLLIMRSSMNTKRKQCSAGDYFKTGSYNLRTRQDMFLYSRVSKTRRQDDDSSGGGGSSSHSSSGGRSHGGGGGRF